MDRGPSWSTHYVCYQPEAKGGHAKHVETGQFVQDAQSMPFGVTSEDDYTNRVSHDGLLTIHDQVIKNLGGRVVEVHAGDADCDALFFFCNELCCVIMSREVTVTTPPHDRRERGTTKEKCWGWCRCWAPRAARRRPRSAW